MLAPFPGFRQLAVFSAVGLAASFLTVILWLPLLDRAAPLPGNTRILAAAKFLCGPSGKTLVIAIGGLVLSADVTRWESRVWRACASTMICAISKRYPVTSVMRKRKIRHLTGMEGGTEFLLVQARDGESALQTEEALIDRLTAARQQGALRGFQAVAQFIPSIKRQRADAELVRDRLMRPFPRKLLPAHRLNRRPPARRLALKPFPYACRDRR